MTDVEKLMRDAAAGFVICEKSAATKNMVLKAIMRGAKNFDSVKEIVDICNDSKCRDYVEALLKIYSPIYDIIFDGSKCSHSHNHTSSTTCETTSCQDCFLNCKK